MPKAAIPAGMNAYGLSNPTNMTTPRTAAKH